MTQHSKLSLDLDTVFLNSLWSQPESDDAGCRCAGGARGKAVCHRAQDLVVQ